MQNEHELEQELETEFELESEGEFEAESELEGEFENELELEAEAEQEFEQESEQELELEAEGEFENEQFLGRLVSGIGNLLGLGESELEAEFEGGLGELEGEQFFGKLKGLGRVIGGFVRKAAPILKQVGRVAAPMVGKALGGVIGGPAGAMLGSKLGNFAASQLREGEFEHEFEQEFEYENEFEQEQEQELESHEQMGELMAHFAAQSESNAEAEAMMGAATVISLSPRDRAALRRVVPQLVRAAALLTRVLRMRRRTRPAVRLVPTIVRRTAKAIARKSATGQPVSPKVAAQVAAKQVRSVLSRPAACQSIIRRSVTAARRAAARR